MGSKCSTCCDHTNEAEVVVYQHGGLTAAGELVNRTDSLQTSNDVPSACPTDAAAPIDGHADLVVSQNSALHVPELLTDTVELNPPEALNKLPDSALLAAVADAVQRKEWCEAEFILLTDFDARTVEEQKQLWQVISKDPVVQDVLHHSQLLWDARLTLAVAPQTMDKLQASGSNKAPLSADKLGYPGFKVLPPVPVNLRTLFPDAPPDYGSDLDSSATLMWCLQDDVLRIKVIGEAPSKHPTLPKAWPVAMTSMFAEVDLIDFMPIFTDKPVLLAKPSLDFATWREQARIRFILSEVSVKQAARMFSPEGVVVIVEEKVTDENDDRVKQVQVPKGYVLSPGKEKTENVLVLGEDHFTYVSTVSMHLPPGTRIPGWILDIVLAWLFPTILRRMFNTAGSIFTDPDYTRRHTEDEVGLYARVLKAGEDGKKRERDTKQKLRMNNPRSCPHQESFSMGKFAERIASFADLCA